jgi:aminocarboxymuconate-semialdehyde decarboxylase
MNVDVHWHHLPEAIAEGILGGRVPVGGTFDRSGAVPTLTVPQGFTFRFAERTRDVGAALAAMDAAGLDVAVPTIPPPLRQYDAPVADGVAFCRAVNDALAEIQQDTGGRLRPLADVPLQDTDAAVAELRRAVGDLGLAGVGVGTNIDGANPGAERFRPFWRVVAELDLFVFFHPETVMGAKDRLCDHELENLVGFPVDTAVAAASMIFDGVYAEVGPLKTCYAHGGGALPYLLSRWDHGWRARIAQRGTGVREPSSYLGSLYCDSLTHGAAQLRFLVDLVGADHVMLGCDFPFDMGDPQPVRTMEAAISDPEARRLIAGENASALLGLQPRVPTG